jgi:calcium channel MID1
LVLPTPLCPSIAYAAPFAANATSILEVPAPLASLPEPMTPLLASFLDAFATSLASKACGRDSYSHTSSCLDCHTAYRDWLCRTLIPRCVDPALPPDSESNIDSDDPDVIPPRTTTRTPSSASGAEYDYTELLPCLGVCNRVDRTCPAFMLFGCPYRDINANETYGFFGQDDAKGDGALGYDGKGFRASDKWGNRWCNGPE